MNSNLSQNRYKPIIGHLINLDGGGGVVGIYVGYKPKHSNLVYIVKVKSRIRNCSCKTFPKNEIEIIAIAEVKNGPKSVRKVLEMPKAGWSCLEYYPILTKDNIVNLSRENMSGLSGNLIFIPYSRKEWERDHSTERIKQSRSEISIW
jgi:hypothetical protein